MHAGLEPMKEKRAECGPEQKDREHRGESENGALKHVRECPNHHDLKSQPEQASEEQAQVLVDHYQRH